MSLLRERVLLGVSPGVMLALALWTLPFLWIGFGMSVRRAADAGRSAWWALLFFVPVLNYVLMVTLSLLPTAAVPEWRRTAPVPVMSDRLKSGLLGIAASLAITIPSVLIGVYLKKSYSAGLFLGTPFSIGYISAHVFNHRHARTVGQTIEVVLIALGLAAGALLLFAAEGAFCLALAFPLAAFVGVCGGLFGRAIALHGAEPPYRTGMAAAFAPLLVLAEPRAPASFGRGNRRARRRGVAPRGRVPRSPTSRRMAVPDRRRRTGARANGRDGRGRCAVLRLHNG